MKTQQVSLPPPGPPPRAQSPPGSHVAPSPSQEPLKSRWLNAHPLLGGPLLSQPTCTFQSRAVREASRCGCWRGHMGTHLLQLQERTTPGWTEEPEGCIPCRSPP